MSQNHSPKSSTETWTNPPDIVATGPHDAQLMEKAQDIRYVLLRQPVFKGRKQCYDLYVFNDDAILRHCEHYTKDYGDAVTWAITQFIEVVTSDN